MARISSPLVFVVLIFLSSASSHHRRLAREVTPTHYYITWAINECDFSGKVAIDIEVKNATDHFKLHARDLKINQETIKLEKLPEEVDVVLNGVKGDERLEYVIGGDSRNLSVNTVRGERLKVSLSEPLEIGSKYRLRMEFNGTLNSKKTSGFFCQRYRQNNQTKWLASATFEPKHARSAFPCFDEPGLKANFTISIAHDKRLIALSNMPLNSSVPSDLGENWVLDTFQTSPKMSTYLVGILVSEYEKIETKLNEKPIRIWGHSNKIEYGDLPLRMATRHLAYLQNYTGIDDPMPKQDFLAIKNYVAGGLENWGLISYEEHLILFNPRYRRQKQVVYRACNLIGHELAHIYFGNLVSVDSWRDIWLNEGFATYYAALSTEQVYRGYGTQAWIIARESAMFKDSKPTSHALRPKTHTDHIFDEISYNKGSSILRMLNFTLGEAVLKEGIRNYLKERIYSTASHKSLWDNLEKAALKAGVVFPEGVNLEQIMESWMNVPGYPLVTANRDYETGEITLTQRSILNKENEVEESESTGWFIPLSYTYQGENKTVLAPRLWLDPRQPNLTIQDPAPSDRWILFNLQGSAYARVRYDAKNAEYLTQDLSDLWIEDRVQVVSDMLELARLGFAPIEGSLNVMSLFKNEISPFPWLAFLSSATKTQSLLENTDLESIYVEFLNTILSAGMERVTDESPHRKELVTLSCKLGVEQCTVMGREMFKKWAEDPRNEIPEDIRYAVLCLGVSEGDAKTWKLVQNRLSKAEEMSEKKDILKALACTKDEKIMLEYLKYGLTTNKTSNPGKKISVILKSLAKQHPDFVFDQLLERKSPTPKQNGRWQRLLEVLADQVNSPKRLEKLHRLVTGSPDSYKAAGSSIPVIAIAEKNLAWMKENKKDVEVWLRNYERQEDYSSTRV